MRGYILNDAATGAVAQSSNVAGILLPASKIGMSITAAVTNSAPAAGVFTAAVTDICTKSAHGYLTGLKVQLTTVTTLPAGLSLATDYFVIYLSANTFSLASSLVNAIAGTAVDITDTGTGAHTITPTAIAGATVKLQVSNDNSVYADLADSSQSITATANFMWNLDVPFYKYIRFVYTLTAGQISYSNNLLVTGET